MTKKVNITTPLFLNKKKDQFGPFFEKNEVNKQITLTVRKLKYLGKELQIHLDIKEKNIYFKDEELCISYICEINENHDFYLMSDSEIMKCISRYLSNLDKKIEQFFVFTEHEDAEGLDQFLEEQKNRVEFHKLTQDENKVSRTTLNVNDASDLKTEIYTKKCELQSLLGYKCYSLTSKGKYEMKLKIFHPETGKSIELCCSTTFLYVHKNREQVHDVFKSEQIVNYNCSVYVGVASKKAYKYELNSISIY